MANLKDPFADIIQTETRPLFPSFFDRSIGGNKGLAIGLTDLLYVEVGPQATLDYQISALKHFVEQSKQELATQPALYGKIRQAVTDLSYTCQRAGNLGWIDVATLAEQSRILQDLNKELSHAHIALRTHLRQQAPSVVDESIGSRKTVQGGEIPSYKRSLQEKGGTDLKPAAYQEPMSFIPKESVTPIQTKGVSLDSKKVGQLATQLSDPKVAPNALQTFRGWASEVLQNPQSLQNFSPQEASQMIGSLAALTNQLPQITTANPLDLADALGTSVAIADHLMSRLSDPKLKDAHLPIPQIAKQLQNRGLFGDLPTSLLQERLQAVQDSGKEPFFAEAIVYNGCDNSPHHHRSYRTETWAFARFDHTPLEQLPPHMQYLLKSNELTHRKPILDYMEKFHLSGSIPEGDFKNLKTIIDSFGRFSAETLVKRTQQTLEAIDKHTQAGTILDIKGVQEWVQHLNPQSIDRLTLEMLTHEQSQQLLTTLGEIAQKAFSSLFYQGSSLPEAETMVSFLEMMALADKVMAYSTHNLLNSYMLPLEKFNEIIDATNPFFCTLTPHLDNVRLQGVRDWLQERRQYSLSDERGHAKALFNDFKGFLSPTSESFPDIIIRSNFFFSGMETYADIELPLISLAARPSIDPLFTVQAFREGEANDQLGINGVFTPEHTAARREMLQKVRQSYFGNGPALPSWFSSLMHLSHATEHMLRSGFINPHPESKSAGDFTHETLPGSLLERLTSTDTLYHRLKGLSPEDAQKFPGIPDGLTRGHLFQHLALPTDGTGGVLEDVRNLHTQPRKKEGVVYRPGINRLPPAVYSEQIAVAENKYSDADVAKFSTRQDPHLQIHRTIDLYQDNPGWLANSNERIELFSLLFQPGLLNRFLLTPKVGPAGEQRLAQFLHTQFRAYEGKPEVQVFLTDVAIRFSQYSAAARKAAPDLYHSIPIPRELEALQQVAKNKLDTQGLDSSQRSAYGALNALSYSQKLHLSQEEVPHFVRSILVYFNHASLPLVSIRHIERELQEMLRRFGPDIKGFLYSGDTLNTVHLQEILAGMVNHPEKMTFTPAAGNPFVLTNAQDGIELNLIEGRLVQKGQEGVSLPMEARMSLPYKMIYADATYRAKVIDSLTYQFTDDQQVVNTLQKDPLDGKWHLYRQIEKGEPHKLVTADWIAPDAAQRKWLQSDWMLQQYSHWYRGGRYPEVRLFDHQGNLAYRVALKGDIIQGIYRKDAATGVEQELADSEQPSYRWVNQYDPGFAHVWLNPKTKQGETIEFPRFGKGGMTFSLRNHHWQSNIDPQYYVADPQVHPFFSGNTPFLRLRTATGAERLLMPRQRPQLSKNGAVSFQRLPEGMTDHMLIAEKNARTGKFEGVGTEANTFLAMQYLATHDYKHTYDLLSSLMGHGERLSDETMKNLDQIIDASQLLKPHDTPQAIAIRTLAAHIKHQNIDSYPQSENDKYPVPELLQKRYLAVSSDIGNLRLPLTEEVRLFEDLLDFSHAPIEDILTQMRLANPQAAQQALDAVLPKLLFGRQRLDVSSLPKSQSVPGEAIAPRKPPVTTEELNTLVVGDQQPKREGLSSYMGSLFNLQGNWFQKLTAPIQQYFREMQTSAETFQGKRDLTHYRLADAQAFHDKRLSLEKDMTAFTKEIEHLRVQILYGANPIPQDPKQADLMRLQELGGMQKPVTMDQLVAAFGSQDLTKYQDLIASSSKQALTTEEARSLDSLVHQFVDLIPDWHYYKRLADAMRQVEEASLHTDTAEQRELLQLALKEFRSATNAGRQFSPEAKRLMHLMEYETGTYYRPLQVEGLGKLGLPGLNANATDSSTYSGVWNIGVGVGKTSRIYPSVLRHYLEQGKPAGLMMPSAQKPTAGAEAARIMKDVYGIDTVDLEFSRSRSTPQVIQTSLKVLKEGIAKGQVIRFTDSGMRSLRSIFLTQQREAAALQAQHKLTPEKEQTVKDLREIIKLIRTIPVLIEEVHKVYEPLIETNFPFGESKPLDKSYGVLILNLVEILGEDVDIQKLMHFNFAPHKRQEGAEPFTEQEFNQKIAPVLVKKFFDRLKDMSKLPDEELAPLARFTNQLSSEHRQELINYLLPKNAAVPAQGAVRSWINGIPEEIKNQLGLLRGEIRVLLPLTLNKQFGVNYGFASEDSLLPNPFSAAGSPRIEAQFFPLALGNYLALANFHEGTRPVMITTIVRDLRQQRAKAVTAAIKEGEEQPLGKRIETVADQEFQRLFHAEDLNLDSPDLQTQLEQRFLHQPALLRQLLKDYAYRQVTTFPQNLKTNSQHLNNLSPNWQGFSGTTDNYRAYPGTFTPPAPDEGKMLTLITEQAALGTHTLQARTPEDLLKDPRFLKADAFIDAAGIVTGKLEQFADAWGDKVGKARIHIDPAKGVVIKQNSADRAISLHTAAIAPDRRVMVYDQPNIVGTDASHKRNAVVIVSVSLHTPFPMLVQACGRARGIESGQTVQLFVLEDDAFVMRQTLGLPPNHPLTHEDVIRHTMIVNAKKQMADNEVALHHKLRAVLENRIFNLLIENALPLDTPHFGQLLDNIFMPESNQSPYDLFGREDTPEESRIVLLREIEGLIGAQSPNTALLTQIFGNQAATMIQEMKQEMEAILEFHLPYISPLLSSHPLSGIADNTQELQQEQQQELQTELQMELQQEKVQSGDKPPAKPLQDWWLSYQFKSKDHDFMRANFWGPCSYTLQGSRAHFIGIRHFLKFNPATEQFSDLFDSRLLASSNYQQKVPLKGRQKPHPYVAIAKGYLHLVDTWDAEHFQTLWQAKQGIHLPKIGAPMGFSNGYFRESDGTFKNDYKSNPPRNSADDPLPVSHIRTFSTLGYIQGELVSVTKKEGPVDLTELFDLDNVYPEQSMLYRLSKFQPIKEEDAEFWLGSLSGGIVAGNDQLFNLKDPSLRRLWAQAQVFGGRFDFTGDGHQEMLISEITAWLQEWATTKATPRKSKVIWLEEAEKMLKQLHAHSQESARFASTDLGRIFASLKRSSA